MDALNKNLNTHKEQNTSMVQKIMQTLQTKNSYLLDKYNQIENNITKNIAYNVKKSITEACTALKEELSKDTEDKLTKKI